jgi:hypothetical protein
MCRGGGPPSPPPGKIGLKGPYHYHYGKKRKFLNSIERSCQITKKRQTLIPNVHAKSQKSASIRIPAPPPPPNPTQPNTTEIENFSVLGNSVFKKASNACAKILAYRGASPLE